MQQYKKSMTYSKMKMFIAMMRKSEWDTIIKGMSSSSAPETDDKKKVQAGMNSSSQDGRQG